MKTLTFILILLSTGLIGTLSSCKSDDPTPSQVKKITELLTSGTWKIHSVTVDDVPHDELFANLNLTFTDNGFTAANGESVWPANGTWEFTDKTATAFTRNDGIVVRIDEISSGELVLSLTWDETTLSGGRVQSISGENVFVFVK